MIKLYHGSNVTIHNIDLSLSKVGKDFGVGFYLSQDYRQAAKQADNTTFRLNSGQPTVTTFLFDEQTLTNGTLNVKTFTEYSREWAEFVFLNRSNRTRIQAHTYDIVYGPIADDTVGVQMRRLTEKYITIDQFVNELKYIKGITFQYFFATPQAIQTLSPI